MALTLKQQAAYSACLASLREIEADGGGDTEGDHISADHVLCVFLRELGCGEIVDAYDAIGKWFA